jgi:hypothetical protein
MKLDNQTTSTSKVTRVDFGDWGQTVDFSGRLNPNRCEW